MPIKSSFYIGDALEIVPGMDIVFDLAFVDGNKRFYVEYYEMILQKMHSGGYIIATIPCGTDMCLKNRITRTRRPSESRNSMTWWLPIHGVEKVILPLRDGLTIIRKK